MSPPAACSMTMARCCGVRKICCTHGQPMLSEYASVLSYTTSVLRNPSQRRQLTSLSLMMKGCLSLLWLTISLSTLCVTCTPKP